MKFFRTNPIKLTEGLVIGPEEISNEIQILRVGTFFHEGIEVSIKKSDLKSMIKNFKNNVRGIDLMLDFSHESEREAAAWFQELYLSENGKELWAKVDWTEDGADSIRKKKYRYVSADFNFAYKDNETLREHGPTLLGAGLTNRPVVKNMNPTILSEHNDIQQEDNKMELEEIKKQLSALQEENKKLKDELAEKNKNMSEGKIKEREDAVALKEKNIKLAEEKVKEDTKLAEKKTEFDKMLSEKRAVEAQRDAFMKNDMTEFVKNAAKAGDLNFSESGHAGSGDKGDLHKNSKTPAQDELISLAEKKVKDDKGLSIDQAQDLVLSENPKLREKYEKETEA